MCAYFLSVLSSPGQTDPRFSPAVKSSYRLLLELKMDSAMAQLPSLGSPTERDYPAIIYIQNLRDVMELLITEDLGLYEQKGPNEKIRLNLAKEMSESDPFRLFLAAEVKLQWAFVKIKFGERFNSAWSVRQAYKYATENSRAFPEFLPDNKTLGLLHILIGSVPEKYSWLLYLMGVDGTILEGVEELEDVKNSHDLFQFESSVLLATVHGYLLHNETEAIATIGDHYDETPQSLFLQYLLALLLMKNSQAEEAIKILEQNHLHRPAYLQLPTLFYLKGEAHLQQGDYALAIKNLNRFLDEFRGKNLIKDAYYKIFLSYWLGGQVELAKEYLILARDNGLTFTEADKQADRQIKQGYPNPILMKIRLLTDGGFYSNAITLIEQHQPSDFKTKRESAEFTYRQARLLHQTKKLDQATEKYKLVVENSEGESWYFAPNSCLQLGYIYQRREKIDLGRKYFQQALTYKRHPYKNSIDNKAKSALDGLK